ncbi:MAG: magnesium transporter CorA family protein [Candidatus Dormiibacterota bacterium]
MRWLVAGQEAIRDPSDAAVSERVAQRDAHGPLWLDLERPEPADLALLKDEFGVHPIALAAAGRAPARPSLTAFQGYAYLALFTATWRGGQVHQVPLRIFLGKQTLITIHDRPEAMLDTVRERLVTPGEDAPGDLVSYLVVDAFVDTLFAPLDGLDHAIDALSDEIIAKPAPAALQRLYRLKHEVAHLHTMLSAQLEVFQRLLTHLMQMRASESLSIAMRSVYDRVVRQFEIVDSLRDLVTSAMDVYLSTVSNNLNVTMAQLTVVASVFLPLTFLTGFFGMNFGLLVGLLTGPGAFAVGMLVMAASIAVMLLIFKRRGLI